MGYLDVIPLYWVRDKRWDLFTEWIRKLMVDDRTKKRVLVEFCDMAGIELTVEKIEECGIEPGTI